MSAQYVVDHLIINHKIFGGKKTEIPTSVKIMSKLKNLADRIKLQLKLGLKRFTEIVLLYAGANQRRLSLER